MIQQYAAAQATSPGTYFQTAAFCLLLGVALIWAGRTQRRTGRGVFSPGRGVRVGDALVAERAPSKGVRALGRVYLVVGWFFVLGAGVNLVSGFRVA